MKLLVRLIATSGAFLLAGCSSSTVSSVPMKTASSAVTAAPAPILTPEQKGQQLLENLSHHTMQVTDHFDAPGGLIGYVVQPMGKKRGSIIYTDKNGEYLFSGNIIDAKGQNVTQQETGTYIDGKLMGEMYQELSGLNYFTEGQDTAPHKIYIFFDPNCSVCHMVYGIVGPMITSGDLQVRWIPVGIMQQSSVGKSAAIMMGKTDAERVALLKQDEDHFDLTTETGGVPELKQESTTAQSASGSGSSSQAPNLVVSHAFELVAKNNQYFSDYGFMGTPVFFLKYQTGEKKFYPGFYQGTWFENEVAKTGADWS